MTGLRHVDTLRGQATACCTGVSTRHPTCGMAHCLPPRTMGACNSARLASAGRRAMTHRFPILGLRLLPLLAAFALLAALTAVACSDDDEVASTATPPPPPTVTAAATASPTAEPATATATPEPATTTPDADRAARLPADHRGLRWRRGDPRRGAAAHHLVLAGRHRDRLRRRRGRPRRRDRRVLVLPARGPGVAQARLLEPRPRARPDARSRPRVDGEPAARADRAVP